jgi:nucleosome binding factor SPN SPT16 subunit
MAEKKRMRVGVFGTGTITQKALKSLLTDSVAAEQKKFDVEFVVPVTKTYHVGGIKTLTDWLVANEVPYIAVTDDAGTRARTLKPYINNASKKPIVAADVTDGLTDIEPDDGSDDEDDDADKPKDDDDADDDDDDDADDDDEPTAKSDDDADDDDADADDDDDEPAPKPSAKKSAVAPSTNGSATLSDEQLDKLADLTADKVITGMAARLQA